MAKEINRPKKCYVAVKSFLSLFSVQVESTYIGKVKMLRCFLFKQLRDEEGVDKLPATQGAWIEHVCAVLMSRLINGTMIYGIKPHLSRPSDLGGVDIPRLKASAGSFSLCFTSSGLSAAAR